MTRIALFAFTVILASTPAMADEFGSRFGNTSPYALQNTFDTANEDMKGLGPEDLNDIAPAAGEEMPDAEQKETPSVVSEDAGTDNMTDADSKEPAVKKDVPVDAIEKESDQDIQPEQDL